jgi:hypothetical protein
MGLRDKGGDSNFSFSLPFQILIELWQKYLNIAVLIAICFIYFRNFVKNFILKPMSLLLLSIFENF